MSEKHGNRSADHGPTDGRTRALAESLGLPLPRFSGPLVAFTLGSAGPDEEIAPVYLGGDLRAVHPDAPGRQAPTGRDPALDQAAIIVSDLENEQSETLAVDGIWCLRLEGERLHTAPYLTLFDSDGHLRVWLLLPPPRLMLGTAHHWLSAVPPVERRDGDDRASPR